MRKVISIVGTGHVGLVTAVCFANEGYDVITSTLNPKKAELIRRGIAPFYESDLDSPLKDAIRTGRLKVEVDRTRAILNSDVTYVTVATPGGPDGSIDLGFVEDASRDIGRALAEKKGYHLVVVKSTVIPGTTEGVVKALIEIESGGKAGPDFGLCMNPEFLREGAAVYDTLHPDKIIIGELDKRSGDLLEDLYRRFYGEALPPVMRTNIPTAEIIKYVNNAFLATKISFINQIANICERIRGVDVNDVARGIGLDFRISPEFLRAGPGFGGSCFHKDVSALASHARALGCEPTLLEDVLSVNDRQARHVVELLKEMVEGGLRGKRVAVLGLAFKSGTDDMRDAPSIRIIDALIDEKARVVAYDPASMERARRIFGERIDLASSAERCIEGADACLLVTEWEEFKRVRPRHFRDLMRTPVLVDTRRIYDPREYSEGISYVAVGLGT